MLDKEITNEIAKPFREIIKSENDRFALERAQPTSAQYLFFSREALIQDFGEDVVKEKILTYEKIRTELNNFTKPSCYEDIVNLWFLRAEEACLKRFAHSKYFI